MFGNKKKAKDVPNKPGIDLDKNEPGIKSLKKDLFNHMQIVQTIRAVAMGETKVDGVKDDTEALQWIVKFIDESTQ